MFTSVLILIVLYYIYHIQHTDTIDIVMGYGTIYRHGIWLMHEECMHGVGGKFLKAVQSFHVDSRTSARLGMDVSEWFSVNIGLRRG